MTLIPQFPSLYGRRQRLNVCCVIPASLAEPGLEESVVFEFTADTQLRPLSPLNLPLEVFLFLLLFLKAEKRAGLCLKKTWGGFNLGNECFAMQPSSRESAKQGRAVY